MPNNHLENEEQPMRRKVPGVGKRGKRDVSPRFNVSLTREMADRVRGEALRSGLSCSAVLRDMVRAAMELEGE